ncbi:hypothetical protein FisN_27Hh014 [Fistulifera solaris]|uniref:Silicon transporter n=1 Tax=Fistulifera solaris TaxID=1519565 RepID=A0A1Z5KPY0_FISSO|nr:hypothetical protein FisN_27Hh014 [Fistulifera solaris]|eukprot:GAX28329.1 hypothetical protein FisN_27Hh014 [Fistulifera solaris]
MDDFCGINFCGNTADVLGTAGQEVEESCLKDDEALAKRTNAGDLVSVALHNDLHLTEQDVEAAQHNPNKRSESQIEQVEDDLSQRVKSTAEIVARTSIEGLKYIVSLALLGFSMVLITAAMFTEQTTATAENGIHPAVTFCVFSFLIVWLAMMEGGQGCLVGLQTIDKTLYAESHPRAFRTAKLAHKGDNMERFMVGRQFLVVLVIFVMNMMSSTVEQASVFSLPESVVGVFLDSGIAVILTTVIVGQLTSQVNAAQCMLDFINNSFMTFTVYVSLAIEMSGLLHSVYLISMLFSMISRKPISSNESDRTNLQKLFFWIRIVFSVVILVAAFVFTLGALFSGKTMAWGGMPSAVSVAIFFLLMCFAGLLDGLQIALFAVVNLTESERTAHPLAHRSCQLVFREPHTLGAFLIGRQICVTVCMFVVARLSAIQVDDTETLFGVSDGVQQFLNTGLLGAVLTTIVASLIWRVIASAFPVAFLSNPLVFVIIRLCLLLEQSGICSASWTLASLQKKLFGFRPDDEYLGDLRRKESTCSNS